jgi:hypothetical protein
MQNVVWGRQVPTRFKASEYCSAVVVGVEKHMSNRADVITRSRAVTRGDRVHADEDYVELGSPPLPQVSRRDAVRFSLCPDASLLMSYCPVCRTAAGPFAMGHDVPGLPPLPKGLPWTIPPDPRNSTGHRLLPGDLCKTNVFDPHDAGTFNHHIQLDDLAPFSPLEDQRRCLLDPIGRAGYCLLQPSSRVFPFAGNTASHFEVRAAPQRSASKMATKNQFDALRSVGSDFY